MDLDKITSLVTGASTAMIVIDIVIAVLLIVSCWLIFRKAGQPGWAAIIPFYNVFVFVRVAQKGWGWALALILSPIVLVIPILGWIAVPIFWLVALIILDHGISTSFGKGGGFTVGLVLLSFIFFPILAFGDATWTAKASE